MALRNIKIPHVKAKSVPVKNTVPASVTNPSRVALKSKRVQPKELELALRDAEMVKLRVQGWEEAAIARRLGISVNTVKRRIIELLKERSAETQENIEIQRQIDVERLEMAADVVMKHIVGYQKPHPQDPKKVIVVPSDPTLAGQLTNVLARKAKTLGTDAATKVEIAPVKREYVGIDIDEV